MSAREEDGEGLPEGVSNVDYKEGHTSSGEKYTVQDIAANYIARLLGEFGNMSLKTCPICGAEAKIESSQVGTAFRVACIKIHKCGLTQHWFDSEQKAILAWNRRSGNC